MADGYQSRYLDLRKKPANGTSVPCVRCTRVRIYTDYDLKKNHVSDLCQPCSVAEYNERRPRKTKCEKKKSAKEWFKKNKKRLAIYGSEYREKIRLEMIAAYGGKCVKCGESDHIVLVLDHINDDAKEDKRLNNHSGGYKMYMYLRRNNWPKGKHQLMCHNCNFKKEYFRRKNAVRINQAS